MTCQQCLVQASEYLDGELAVEDRERFEVHLARCASCARYHRVLQRGLKLVHALPEVEPSPDFEDRLRHRLFHLQDDLARPPRFRASGAALSLAVAGLIAFAAWGPFADEGGAYAETTAVDVAAPGGSEGRQLGGSDAWFLGTPTYGSAGTHSSTALAFPGPYSPLIVQPPMPSQSPSRVHFTGLGLE